MHASLPALVFIFPVMQRLQAVRFNAKFNDSSMTGWAENQGMCKDSAGVEMWHWPGVEEAILSWGTDPFDRAETDNWGAFAVCTDDDDQRRVFFSLTDKCDNTHDWGRRDHSFFCETYTREAPSPSATAQGDPHCENVKGEKFDITVQARHIPMLIMPRNSSAGSTVIVVEADIVPNPWSECVPGFFNKIDIRISECSMELSPGEGYVPATSKNQTWDVIQCNGAIKSTENGNAILLSMPSLGLKFKIDQASTKFQDKDFKFLNLEVTGHGLKDAGGILGNDPHDAWTNNGNNLCARATKHFPMGVLGSSAKSYIE